VGESVRYPIKYYSNNLNGTLSILNGMRIHRIPNILFSSSCTVYGQPDQLPVDESAPIKKAESPYGNTKRISEEMIKDYVDSHDDSFAISLRYFNPIGAHPTAIIGENPMGIPDNLVPYITQTAIGKHKELKVFGDDYDTPDGTAIRDYLHVVDLAKAHVIAIQRLLNKETSSKFDIFNLGTGRGTSVLEMIQAFTRVSGINLNYRIVKRRPGDVERVWADTSHANQVLGWKALSSIDDAMLTAWNWEKRLSKLSN
jgi:UDP-glucose 4-epimerase